jgi:hypothetical protein
MDMITAETRPIILETVHPEVKMMIEECWAIDPTISLKSICIWQKI